MTSPQTIRQAFELALQYHRAGRLTEAEPLYRQILATQPQHAGALHFLGAIAHQTGNYDAAIELIRTSIALAPGIAEAHNNLGNSLKGKGELVNAIAEYRKAISLRPNFPSAQNNLASALRDNGQLDESLAACRKALSLQPNFADAEYNLGIVLKDKGQIAAAIAAYRQAIAHRPKFAQAHNNLGIALKDSGKLDEAVAAYRHAIALHPGYFDAHYNLGNALHDQRKFDDAIAAYRHAIALRPDHSHALNNLGVSLKAEQQYNEAIGAFRQAIHFQLPFPDAYNNLGSALNALGHFDDALAAYETALAQGPDSSEAHYNVAMARLLRGDLAGAWPHYEWRWKIPNFSSPDPAFAQPRWDGGRLDGRTLLLHAEQGLGDTIQFIRYLPMAAAKGGRTIVQAQQDLLCILQQLPGADQWIAKGLPLPRFDVHCPLLSLPLVFSTSLATIPAQQALHPEPTRLEAWRQRIQSTPGLKVALAWAGNPKFEEDRTRSLSLDRLAHLLQIPGVTFFSVQKGVAAQQAEHPPKGARLVNLSPHIHDFADTAAIMSLVDLVITTDTSVAHLAGATGRPVWVMLQFVPDWRWLPDRSDSPWYPSMRLFRQPAMGDWNAVIESVAEALLKHG